MMGCIRLAILMMMLNAYGNDCARILGIFHIPSKSHHILGSRLLRYLAEKGHEVTMVSPYPFKDPIKNYRDIFLEEPLRYKEGNFQSMLQPNTSYLEKLTEGLKMFSKVAEMVLLHPEVQKLQQEKFDLIIQYALSSESLLGLAHHFNAPVILFNTFGSVPMLDKLTGNVSPPAYTPSIALPISGKMTFLQRVINTLSVWLFYGIISDYMECQQQEVLTKYFPDAPSIPELTNKIALVFLNSHYSIETPRSYVPSMIQIGGVHIEEPKELVPGLKQFLDEATDGAIFFSLGSNIKISSLPADKVQGVISALGKLKMKVLFKSEQNSSDLPPNVKIDQWLPQNDILAHPNVKLFITHGGLLSTTEAVHHAVPIIAIPIFGDQMSNAAIATANGYAITVDLNTVDENQFSQVLEEILTNAKYRENIQLRSSLIRGQPVKPLDSAIFWVEHVLKYKGAEHLKIVGAKLSLYQYLLIDVILFILVILFIVFLTIYFIARKFIRFVKSTAGKLKRKTD